MKSFPAWRAQKSMRWFVVRDLRMALPVPVMRADFTSGQSPWLPEAVGSAGVGEVAERGEVARDKGVLDAFRRKLGAGGEIALGPGLDGAAIAIRLRLENEAECDQANGGERAGKISERRLHGFTRYPPPRMVSMCAAQSPSFLRRPTSWTSTVRSVTDFSSSWTMSMIWARV